MAANRREGRRSDSYDFTSKFSSRSTSTSPLQAPHSPQPLARPPTRHHLLFPSCQHGRVLSASARHWPLSHLLLPPVELDTIGLGNNLEVTRVPLPAVLSY